MAIVFIRCLRVVLFLSPHRNQRKATVDFKEHYINITALCNYASYNGNKQDPTFSDFDLSVMHVHRFLHRSRSDPCIFQIENTQTRIKNPYKYTRKSQ